MDIRQFNAGNVGELAATIESNLIADRYFQRGEATMIEVAAVTFDLEQNKIIAKTLQTDIHGSSYVDVEINSDLERADDD
jgi:hypothetical protein